MKTTLQIEGNSFEADLSQPIDISIPVSADGVQAFYILKPVIEPVRIGDFVGAVNEGGSCNVNNIFFNPHGNGTHTECVGHISRELNHIIDSLKQYFFPSFLLSVSPAESADGDYVITLDLIKDKIPKGVKALVLRTIPNPEGKLHAFYSGKNPPYIAEEAMEYIVESGILHLITDLPSVDREEDGGKLLAHHAFWKYPHSTRLDATITELVYIPDTVADGFYLLNLMISGFANDAAPSKPILYKLRKTQV